MKGTAVSAPTKRTVVGAPRRALMQVGGAIEVWNDERSMGGMLASALGDAPDPSAAMRHVHGFHSYPARMHPDTASKLVEGLTREGQTVLDPFSGSGTVLVEARLLGREAFGVDANPLAVMLAQLKLTGLKLEADRDLLLAAVEAVAEFADDRRRGKAGPSKPYSHEQRALFAPHVLLELDGLAKGIKEQCPAQLAPALWLILSSLLTKVSGRRSDTSQVVVERRLASGFAIRFFKKKGMELVGRLGDYSRQVKNPSMKAGVRLGDARQLPMNDSRAHAIITSPPYPGVYDYVDHHRTRLDWLGLDAKYLEMHEIGAHRHFAAAAEADATARWQAQMGDCLAEMRRVLTCDGKAVLLIADSVVAGQAFYADRALDALAPIHGLRIVGAASQVREHYHPTSRDAFRSAPRREHLILLEKSPNRDEPAVKLPKRPSSHHKGKVAPRRRVRQPK